jgi:3-oxoacyl-[acyl-carrier-protein] synthase II
MPLASLQVVSPACLVTSSKGSLGHLLGAAGAVESAFSCLSLAQGTVPPCANLDTPDPELAEGLHLVTGAAHTELAVEANRIVLKNSFGFGGTNVSLVFRAWGPSWAP